MWRLKNGILKTTTFLFSLLKSLVSRRQRLWNTQWQANWKESTCQMQLLFLHAMQAQFLTGGKGNTFSMRCIWIMCKVVAYSFFPPSPSLLYYTLRWGESSPQLNTRRLLVIRLTNGKEWRENVVSQKLGLEILPRTSVTFVHLGVESPFFSFLPFSLPRFSYLRRSHFKFFTYVNHSLPSTFQWWEEDLGNLCFTQQICLLIKWLLFLSLHLPDYNKVFLKNDW